MIHSDDDFYGRFINILSVDLMKHMAKFSDFWAALLGISWNQIATVIILNTCDYPDRIASMKSE